MLNDQIRKLSIVRQNLMNREGYSGYCGGEPCRYNWPRTTRTANQFKCPCGWTTRMDIPFMIMYERKWGRGEYFGLNNKRQREVLYKYDDKGVTCAAYRVIDVVHSMVHLQKLNFETLQPIPYVTSTVLISDMADYFFK